MIDWMPVSTDAAYMYVKPFWNDNTSYTIYYGGYYSTATKAGTFLDEDLENEYEDVTTFANDVEKVLSKVGIKVRDTNHDFRNTQDILDDIAERWETFTDLPNTIYTYNEPVKKKRRMVATLK